MPLPHLNHVLKEIVAEQKPADRRLSLTHTHEKELTALRLQHDSLVSAAKNASSARARAHAKRDALTLAARLQSIATHMQTPLQPAHVRRIFQTYFPEATDFIRERVAALHSRDFPPSLHEADALFRALAYRKPQPTSEPLSPAAIKRLVDLLLPVRQ